MQFHTPNIMLLIYMAVGAYKQRWRIIGSLGIATREGCCLFFSLVVCAGTGSRQKISTDTRDEGLVPEPHLETQKHASVPSVPTGSTCSSGENSHIFFLFVQLLCTI